MTITLKPEQERIIQTEIQSGHFRGLDSTRSRLGCLARKGAQAQDRNAAEESGPVFDGVSTSGRRVEPGEATGLRTPH